ncbi:MAG: hypothetical protein QE271_10665 [Bacteriovoracaceae bacterium]|nr:hypothetical protein [Bacteriovoracaceae bacterium]
MKSFRFVSAFVGLFLFSFNASAQEKSTLITCIKTTNLERRHTKVSQFIVTPGENNLFKITVLEKISGVSSSKSEYAEGPLDQSFSGAGETRGQFVYSIISPVSGEVLFRASFFEQTLAAEGTGFSKFTKNQERMEFDKCTLYVY